MGTGREFVDSEAEESYQERLHTRLLVIGTKAVRNQ
jgi:hypothetical protein